MNTPIKTDKAHWQRLSALLDDALTLPPIERNRWLESLPAQDVDLLPTLRAMLTRSSVETDTFLAAPVPLHQFLPAHSQRFSRQHEDAPGDHVGPYQLIKQIGTGGMGTVWLAERVDGSPKRQVALKLPHVDRASGLAERMRREGNILATLEHQNIARLYDAGVTATATHEDGSVHEGRPYLAMEYVQGQPIDAFCEERKLDIASRLRLFVQVTRAVSHAHTRLVVHRDLKPSNILVSKNGDVKLLDFGVAKLLTSEAEETGGNITHFTQIMGRALTPDYASPEQIRGESIGVASDVYSLGVVLYELLTGKRPYKLKRDSIAALEEAITEAVIPFASTVAERKRARVLRGDLDTILAKTLKKSVARRYQSVDALATDLARFLVGKPVLAQKDSRAYRWRKFVGRHMGSILTALFVIIALGSAGGITFWQARVARDEAARATAVKQYMASIFTSATPKEGFGGVVTASDLLTAATQRVESELVNNPEVAAEIGVMIAESFDALGEPEKAEALLRGTVARSQQVFGRQHNITIRGKLLLAGTTELHDPAGALTLMNDVLPDVLAALPATANEAVNGLMGKSFMLAKLGRQNESLAALEESIAIGEKYLSTENESVIYALSQLSNISGWFGDRNRQLQTGAEAMRRAGIAFGTKRPHNTLTTVERRYAAALRVNDRPADAIPILQQVLNDQQRLDNKLTERVESAQSQLALAQSEAGQMDKAIPLLREVVASQEKLNPAETDSRAAVASDLAGALIVARLADEARKEDNRARVIYERINNRTPKGKIAMNLQRARILTIRGEHIEAAQLATDAAAQTARESPEMHAEAVLIQAFNARMQGNHSALMETMRHIYSAAEFRGFRLSLQSYIAAELGTALIETNDLNGAEAAFAQCAELFKRAQIDPSVRVATCLIGQARLHLQAGRAQEAERVLAPLIMQWSEINPNSPWHGEALYWTARAQEKMGKSDEARRNQAAAAVMLKKSNLPALKKLAGK